MRTEVKFFTFSALFSLAVAGVYWFLSYEDAGSTLLLFMFLAPFFVGAFLAYRGWRMRLAENDPNASHPAEAGAPVGRFSTGSIWPFLMGLGVAVVLEGFIFGIWLLMVGMVLFLAASVGLMQESRG